MPNRPGWAGTATSAGVPGDVSGRRSCSMNRAGSGMCSSTSSTSTRSNPGAGALGGADQPRIVGGELELVVVDVPTHDLLGVRQVGQQRLAEPAVAGADVEHAAGGERAVVGEHPAVGPEALDLPRVAADRRAAFGEIHAGGGYSLARRRSRDAVLGAAIMTETSARSRTAHRAATWWRGRSATGSRRPRGGGRPASAVLLPIVVAVVRALVAWLVPDRRRGAAGDPRLRRRHARPSAARIVDVCVVRARDRRQQPGPALSGSARSVHVDVRAGVRDRHGHRDRRRDDQRRAPRSAPRWSAPASAGGVRSAGCCCSSPP